MLLPSFRPAQHPHAALSVLTELAGSVPPRVCDEAGCAGDCERDPQRRTSIDAIGKIGTEEESLRQHEENRAEES